MIQWWKKRKNKNLKYNNHCPWNSIMYMICKITDRPWWCRSLWSLKNSNKVPDIEPIILCQKMLQILIALLKVCIHILTFITRALESWSQRNKKDRGTQADNSLCSICENRDGTITSSASSIPEAKSAKSETAVNKNVPTESGKLKCPLCPTCNGRMTLRTAHRG